MAEHEELAWNTRLGDPPGKGRSISTTAAVARRSTCGGGSVLLLALEEVYVCEIQVICRFEGFNARMYIKVVHITLLI